MGCLVEPGDAMALTSSRAIEQTSAYTGKLSLLDVGLDDGRRLAVPIEGFRHMFQNLADEGLEHHATAEVCHGVNSRLLGSCTRTRGEVEHVRWPLVRDKLENKGMSTPERTNYQGDRAALRELACAGILSLTRNPELMEYPEVIAIAEGVPFRYPRPTFIGDFSSIVSGADFRIQERAWLFACPDLRPGTNWRAVVCPSCGSRNSEPLHVIGPCRTVRCCECELQYANPQARIQPSDMDKYGLDHRPSQASKNLRALRNSKALIMSLKRYVPHSLGTPLLDVGCASGEVIAALRNIYGWKAASLWGVEPAPRSASKAREKGIRVVQALVEEAELPKAFFGVILVLNTIEHISDPRSALANLKQSLRPGGVMVLMNVPNVTGLSPRLFPEGFVEKNFADGQTRCFYSPKTLERLCTEAGLQCFHRCGRTRDIVEGRLRETAAWLSYTSGVRLASCSDERLMLLELTPRILKQHQQGNIALPARAIKQLRNIRNSTELVTWWREQIWTSAERSEAFELWLRSA